MVVVVVVVVGSVARAVQVVHIVIVAVVHLVQHHVEVAAIDTRLLHARNLNAKSIHRQARQYLPEHALSRLAAQIEQSGHEHVARDPRRAIEIKRPRASSPR